MTHRRAHPVPSKHALSRRLFLRGAAGGAAVTVALPLLEGMLNTNGSAFADGTPRPTRFGVWFFGNGVLPSEWGVSGTGTTWTPRRALVPVAEGWGRDYLTVLSGLTVPAYGTTATYKNDPHHNYNHGHHSGAATALSGDQFQRRVNDVAQDGAISSHFRHASIDQVAAAYFEERGLLGSKLRSLEVSVVGRSSTREGPTFRSISQNGGGLENPPEYVPAALFERLFGTKPGAMGYPKGRASVLDAVREDFGALSPKLSAADRRRAEQHLEGVRSLEKQLAAADVACKPPKHPGQHPELAMHDAIAPKNAAFAELVTYVLACDLTRVFSMAFTRVGSPLYHAASGLKAHGHHSTSHGSAWEVPIGNATVFTMRQLRVLMDKLHATPDGDGTLLDHLSMLVLSEHGNGHTHDTLKTPLPALIVGKGGGRLRGNRHWVRTDASDCITRAGLTALHGAGVALPSWGRGIAAAKAPIAEALR